MKSDYTRLRIALDRLEEEGLPVDFLEDAFSSVGPKYLDIMRSLGWKKPAIASEKFDWMIERDFVLEGLRALRDGVRYPDEIPRPARDAARVFVERNQFRETTTVGAAFEIRDLALMMTRSTTDIFSLVNETARQIAAAIIRREEAKHLLHGPHRTVGTEPRH